MQRHYWKSKSRDEVLICAAVSGGIVFVSIVTCDMSSVME